MLAIEQVVCYSQFPEEGPHHVLGLGLVSAEVGNVVRSSTVVSEGRNRSGRMDRLG